MKLQKILVKTIAVTISAAIAASSPCSHFSTSIFAAETEDEMTEEEKDILDRYFGYEEPQDLPYVFAEGGEEAAEGNAEIVTTEEDGILRSAATELFATAHESRYVTSASSYAGGGTTPAIANALKADDQSGTGLCWIYATNKAMEANLYKSGKSANLSEKNTAYYFWNKADAAGSEGDALRNAYNYMTYAGPGTSGILTGRELYGRGGNTLYLDNYLAAWKGIVSDSGDNKFEASAIADETIMYTSPGAMSVPSVSDVYSKNIGHVKNIYRTPATDSDAIKTLIKKYGAVTHAVYTTYGVAKYGTCAWYNPVSNGTNHQITIIGWDDNYSRDNFQGNMAVNNGKPSSNGAWYCMNSWGPNATYCDSNGGFWLSYEDKTFTSSTLYATAFDVAAAGSSDFYGHNYVSASASSLISRQNYTAAGTPCGISYTASGLSNSTGFEQVKAVGFNTYKSDTSWKIRGYKGENAANGILVSEQTVTIPYIGFHTVELATPFKVKEGEKFYVEIEPVSAYYIEYAYAGSSINLTYNSSVEYNGTSYQYKTTSRHGDSYGTTYINGTAQGKLSDGTTKQIVLHAYTNDCSSPNYSTLSTSTMNVTYDGRKDYALSNYYSFTAGKDDSGNNTFIKSASSSNENVAAVDLAGNKITAKKNGTATITLVTSDLITATISVKVSAYGLTASNTTISGIGNYIYNGTQWKPAVTVSAGSRTLISGTDYSVSYGANINAGTGTVTITGKNNYSGNITKTFSIAKRTITRTDISGIDSLYEYTGNPVNPVPVVTANGTELIPNTDYTVAYGTNTAIGNGSVTVTGKGNYSGTVVLSFEIKSSVVKSVLTAKERIRYTYGYTETIPFTKIMTFTPGTGFDGSPTTLLTVSSDNPNVADINMATNRVVLYKNNNFLNIGKANIRFETSDGCTATTSITVEALSLATSAKISISGVQNTYRFTGEDIVVNPILKMDNYGIQYPLAEGKDYELSYVANNAPGYGYVDIKGIGNYTNYERRYFRIITDSTIENLEDKTVSYGKDKEIGIEEVISFIPGKEVDADNTSPAVGEGNGVKETSLKEITSSNTDIIGISSNKLKIKSVGESEITVTTSDGQEGAVKIIVAPADIEETEISNINTEYTYTGNAITPEPVVTISGNVLEKNTDYALDYSYCTDVGTGIITITGAGNYGGTKETGFLIVPEIIGKVSMSGVSSSYEYTGEVICPEPEYSLNGTVLTEGRDYSVEYSDHVEAGTVTITASGHGNFTDSREDRYEISPASIAKTKITGVNASYDYTGDEICPEINVTFKGTALENGKDYTVAYKNNVDAGTAKYTIKGKGNFTGSVSGTFLIKKTSGNEPDPEPQPQPEDPEVEGTLEVSIGIPAQGAVYTGSEIRPAVTVKYVKDGKKTIVGEEDYDVGYSDNLNVGTATVKITMSGTYNNETITKTFAISAARIGSAAISGIKKSYVYADTVVIPAMTLTYNGLTLTEGTDYTVEYEGNNAPGTATYTLTGINNFTGTRSGEYTINAEATGEEEIEIPVDPIPDTPDEPDPKPQPQPEDPEDNPDNPEDPEDEPDNPEDPKDGPDKPEVPEENKGGQQDFAEETIAVSDNKPMDYRTEEKGEYKISYGHGVPFWGNSKITAEYFGYITVSHNGAEYKATKIKVNKKKHLIQILKLAGADKAIEKAIKKATKGSAGLSFTMNPYYVRNSDTLSIKTKGDGSIKSLKVTINGKAYKAKKTEFSQDSSTGKISFTGNLAGSYGGNETGSEASAASIETVEISNADNHDVVYAPENVPEASETGETTNIEETVETEEKDENGASERLYEEAEIVSSNEIVRDENVSGEEADKDAKEVEYAVSENEEIPEEEIFENEKKESIEQRNGI